MDVSNRFITNLAILRRAPPRKSPLAALYWLGARPSGAPGDVRSQGWPDQKVVPGVSKAEIARRLDIGRTLGGRVLSALAR
jgi:hypothetical protein